MTQHVAQTSSDNRTIMVTGGAGFLGSFLCEKLLASGANVMCVDNLETGRYRNIERLLSNSAFTFHHHDVCNPFDRFEPVDEIYNFACPASPKFYQLDPVRTMQTNVLGALNTLNFAKNCGAKFLQASTSEIYGDPLVHPQTESYLGNVNTTGIRACYDEGKRAAETLVYDFQRKHGVNVRTVRIFNTYGPGMQADDGRVVSNFIVQALKGENLTIYGDGSQTRSFCYRDDLINGITALMNADDIVSFPVNIGNPNEFTMLELAQLVIELTGTQSKLVFLPLPQDDPLQRCPDISLAKANLGWQPKVELREGLARTIEYFRAGYGA